MLIFMSFLKFLIYRYNNTEDEPDIITRTIEFLIYDGMYTASFNVLISSEPINDHPTVVR